jgi:hypothetical protein
MLKLRALLIAGVVAAAGSALAGTGTDRSEERWRLRMVAPACERAPDIMACLASEVAKLAPCTGTVEERLTCLEHKVLTHAEELYWLKRQLEERTSPQIRPLGSATDQTVR